MEPPAPALSSPCSEPKRAKLDSDYDDDDAMEVDHAVATATSISLKSTPTSISLKSTRETSDRDVLTHLRAIVLRVEDYDSTTLGGHLKGLEFLQVDSLSRNKDEILDQVLEIYMQARKLEAQRIPTLGDLVDERYCEAAIEIRNAILHSELEEIGEEGMRIYKGFVPDVQNAGNFSRVLLRPEDTAFWDRCIELSLKGHPVCGVGNPGIGKTTTVIYLLERLVRDLQKPVVYTIRKKEGRDIFYEFIPVIADGELEDITVNVYRIVSTYKKDTIATLNSEDTFYVVDPGTYEHSCDDRDEDIKARFVMAASNNSDHWGGNNFQKSRVPATPLFGTTFSTKKGILVYGCLWTEPQVLLAKPYLGPLKGIPANELLHRFRIVGGSLRDLMAYDEVAFTDLVDTGLGLEPFIVHELVEGRHKFTFKKDAPSSVLIAIGPCDDSLTRVKIMLKSDYVEERLARKYLQTKWYEALDEGNAGNRGNLFESYIRDKFSQGPVKFSCDEARESLRERPLTETGKPSTQRKQNYQKVPQEISVGSPRTVARVSNMIEEVRTDTSQNFLYYSKDEREPLIDMIFRVDDGFHAIQSTIAKSHKAKADKIRTLKERLQLGDGSNLRIYFGVPTSRFEEFVTDPANPLLDESDLSNVYIYHISVSAAGNR